MRTSQTAKNQRKIKKLYEDMAKDIGKELQKTGKDKITRVQLTLLQRDVEQRAREVTRDIVDGIQDSMITTANTVVMDTRVFLRSCGFKRSDISKAFFYVPDNVVRNIVSGAIYQKGWTLSKAIWGHTKEFNEKLSEIVARGAASGKSAYEIAKDLEGYVRPSEAKQAKKIVSWVYKTDANGNKVLDEKGEPIKVKAVFYPGKVDYNAMRLARTMISHAYQQSFEMVNRNNPFVIGYRWLTSNFHGRVCSICREREETDQYGLGEGVFPKEELPLDHPNGMCTFEAVIPEEPESIAGSIKSWYDVPLGTYPDLDKFAEDFIVQNPDLIF